MNDEADQFSELRDRLTEILKPIRPATDATDARGDFLLRPHKSEASKALPPYYLVYFLLVDLLGFRDLGMFEKVAWSVPLDFGGRAFLVEHRKFGLGVFVQDPERDAPAAREIVSKINWAVNEVRPYFRARAARAIESSEFNVQNRSARLWERYRFLRDLYDEAAHLANAHQDKDAAEILRPMYTPAGRKAAAESGWLAISAIEAFFAWTEHVLIHLAIVTCRVSSGPTVAELVRAEWAAKFKAALDLDGEMQKVFNELVLIRRQVRNYVSHGSFGKEGEAFRFHSGAGVVPVRLDEGNRGQRFTVADDLGFVDSYAFEVLDTFAELVWMGPRAPAKMYIQADGFPSILTFASDGTYERVMASEEDMGDFLEELAARFDQAANMDW